MGIHDGKKGDEGVLRYLGPRQLMPPKHWARPSISKRGMDGNDENMTTCLRDRRLPSLCDWNDENMATYDQI